MNRNMLIKKFKHIFPNYERINQKKKDKEIAFLIKYNMLINNEKIFIYKIINHNMINANSNNMYRIKILRNCFSDSKVIINQMVF